MTMRTQGDANPLLMEYTRRYQASHDVRRSNSSMGERQQGEQVDFFISYCSIGKDQAWAEWMAWELEQAGYRVHFQGWDVRPGSNIVKAMDYATKRAERTVVVLSQASLASDGMLAQWAVAFGRDSAGKEGRVLPVRIDACEITGLLGSIAFIDLVDLEEQQARERLLKGVRQQRVKPSTVPFPASGPRAIFPPSFSPLWHVPHPRNPYFIARGLCHLLDRLPLALDQAGAYLAENGGSLQTYLDLYEHSRPILLDRRHAATQPDHPNGSEHPDSVLMTFWLSWEQIQTCDPLAGQILQFCAFLAPEQIPEQLVWEGIDDTIDHLKREEALGLLHRYSLIERREALLSLHRLVQEVMQEVLAEEEREQWMHRAVLAVNAAFPDVDHETWPLCEFLLPHALLGTKWTLLLKQKRHEGARLLAETGRYLAERGQYREAEPLLQQALSMREKLLGSTHLHTATSLNDLALLYKHQGRYGEAEPLLQRALSIWEEQPGTVHPEVVAYLNNLAALYEAQSRYKEVEPLLQKALLMAEEQLGSIHPNTAMSLNYLAQFYEVQGRYAEGEPLYRRALAIREEKLGPSHPDTATSLDNLALLYKHQGRYAEAESLMRRALAIKEEQVGATHPATATSLNNLAGLYRKQGRYAEAELLYQQAATICQESLGVEHPVTQQIGENYLMLLADLHTNGDVEALFYLLAQHEQDNPQEDEPSPDALNEVMSTHYQCDVCCY